MFVLLSLLACHPKCGDYTVSTGVFVDHVMGDLWTGDPRESPDFFGDPEEVYEMDGDYYEECGKKWGTFASYDSMGDGRAYVWFRLDDRNFHRDLNGLYLDVWASFPNGSLAAGTTIPVGPGNDDVHGEASLVDGFADRFKLADVTEGSITITSGELSDDVCTEDEGWAQGVGPTFGLSWDLVWDNPAEEARYTARGEDKVFFDTFLTPACDPYL